MANVTDLQTKYSKLAQEYSKVNPFLSRLVVITPDIKADSTGPRSLLALNVHILTCLQGSQFCTVEV